MKTVPCKGCGREIVFARTEDGKTIPLEKRSTGLYQLTSQTDAEPLTCARVGDAYISHFLTCPKAGDFSGSRSGKKGGPATAQQRGTSDR